MNPASAGNSTVSYEFARWQSMTQWWHWMALATLVAAIAGYVVWMYRRDTVELRRTTAVALVVLRLIAFGGILFFFFDLEKRSIQRIEKPSRVVVLADTSQSMGMQDRLPAGATGPVRIESVVKLFDQSPFLQQMRERHEVVVYRFDEQEEATEVATFPRRRKALQRDREASASTMAIGWQARRMAGAAAGLLLLALLAWVGDVLRGGGSVEDATAWGRLAAMVLVLAAVVTFSVATLLDPRLSLRQIVGLDRLDTSRAEEPAESVPQAADPQIEWASALLPRGRSTRIGDAVRFAVRRHRSEPLAGIVLLTDGAQNEGISAAAAVAAAREANVPLYVIGMGSDRKPVNVRVVDVDAPQRVFPGDPFSLTAYIQSFGMEGRSVRVRLVSAPEKSTSEEDELLEEERRVTLEEDGRVTSLEFELTPEEQGVRVYRLRIDAPVEDFNPNDNQQGTTVNVVDRKTRVLLLAGGPTREYRFLRNLLYRDEETEVDVLLQSAPEGASQEADEILDDFPATPDELFEYDAIVAFDPDWMAFSEPQIALLERWVAEQAGGLVVVAGPIYTPEWSTLRRGRDRRADLIRALYPVEFYSQGAPTLSLGRFGGTEAWPLDFTRDGLEAPFLRLEDDATDSEEAWASFEGVYGYYAVRDPKPGARVYARFSDPETAIDDELPIYMAGHLYGAGRVFFQASGEMWRLRAHDERYFETYYMKLVRHMAQGRLLRDSKRGLLLVDKERIALGDSVEIRAILSDTQHRPLVREQVEATVVTPSGKRIAVELPYIKNASREGTYAVTMPLLEDGDHRIELMPPDALADELLVKTVQVRSTDREMANSQRNDPLLKELADKTNGLYYIGTSAALGEHGERAVMDVIPPADQITFVSGSPDSRFDERLMLWLMIIISGVLFAEWTIRRLSKLA